MRVSSLMAATITPMVRYVPFLLALAAPTLVGLGQQVATGAISGVVLDGSSGEAVADAVVFLAATPARPLRQPRQVTDERGRFAFVDLPGDVSYTISATKLGYLGGGYGRDATPGDPLRPIPLKAGEWIPNIKVSLSKPGSISGIVRDESGEPVVGVVVRALQRVRIQGREDFVAGPLTRTDDRGTYRISNLAPGRYLLQVPSVQAAVPASAVFPAAMPNGTATVPDDVMDVDDTQRLVIGRYPLPPPPLNGRQVSYPSIFYPSTAVVADATTISLKYGDDRSGIDLALAPVASVRVSGIVEGPPEALEALTLRLLPIGLENLGFGAEIATALVAPDGRFTFLNVPAGSYTIDAPTRMMELSSIPAQIGPRRVLPGPPTTPVAGATISPVDLIPGVTLTNYNYRFVSSPYSGRAPVTVGAANVTGLVIRLRPHSTISGRVVAELDPARPDLTVPRFAFLVDPAGGGAALTGAGRSGRGGGSDQLSVVGVIPGRYWLRITGSPDWLVKSITWNGKDYTNTPLDATDAIDGVVVTVTSAVPELTGVVRSTDDLKADATMVIVFPVDPALWRNTGLYPARVKSATVSSNSVFRFTPLPAGDYLIAAVSRSFSETWREPEFLARAARSASRVTLTWAGKSSVDLNATVIR
jgi:carboxypeptidase family protein